MVIRLDAKGFRVVRDRFLIFPLVGVSIPAIVVSLMLIRLDAKGFRVVRDRFLILPLVVVSTPAIVVSLMVIRLDANGFRVVRDRPINLPGVVFHLGPQPIHQIIIGFNLNGPIKVPDRRWPVLLQRHYPAPLFPRLHKLRSEHRCPPQRRSCITIFPLSFAGHPQPKPRQSLGRPRRGLHLNCPLKGLRRLFLLKPQTPQLIAIPYPILHPRIPSRSLQILSPNRQSP